MWILSVTLCVQYTWCISAFKAFTQMFTVNVTRGCTPTWHVCFPSQHKHLRLVFKDLSIPDISQNLIEGKLVCGDFACKIVIFCPLTKNKTSVSSQKQQKVTEAWHSVVVVRQEPSGCESTQPKASRWLPPSRTSSLVTLDLLGLGACVGLGRDGFMYTIADTGWSSAAECYTFVSLDMRWQGIRLIKQMCPAANNVHVQGVFLHSHRRRWCH